MDEYFIEHTPHRDDRTDDRHPYLLCMEKEPL